MDSQVRPGVRLGATFLFAKRFVVRGGSGDAQFA